MITVYGLGSVPQTVIGVNRDLRVEWALEEMGIPYQFHGLNFRNGEHLSTEYRSISPFQLVPAIVDDGFSVAESGAILLYLAEKNGRLIPADFNDRIHVVQWCFSILNTLEKKLHDILIDFNDESVVSRHFELKSRSSRWLHPIESHLERNEWIAHRDFTVADILLVTVLRGIRHSRLVEHYPYLKSYVNRSSNRPAWNRALLTYSQRTGKSVLELQLKDV